MEINEGSNKANTAEPRHLTDPSLTVFGKLLAFFHRWAVDQTPAPGKYAMWWPSDDGLGFGDSEVGDYIERAYRALDGIESRVFASILFHLGAIDNPDHDVNLPEDPFSVYFIAHENLSFFFTASQEKGLRFHFHVEKVDTDVRDGFWLSFAEYAEAWRRGLTEAGENLNARSTEEHGSGPLEWWLLTKEAIDVSESVTQAPVQMVGALVI